VFLGDSQDEFGKRKEKNNIRVWVVIKCKKKYLEKGGWFFAGGVRRS